MPLREDHGTLPNEKSVDNLSGEQKNNSLMTSIRYSIIHFALCCLISIDTVCLGRRLVIQVRASSDPFNSLGLVGSGCIEINS